MCKRETGALRDQKQAKIAILAQNFRLFGILSIHLQWELGFQFGMSEPMREWKQTVVTGTLKEPFHSKLLSQETWTHGPFFSLNKVTMFPMIESGGANGSRAYKLLDQLDPLLNSFFE